jgi:transposase
MISPSASVKINVATKFIDFRKRLDGIAAFCRNDLKVDPYSGEYFVFFNKTHTHIRCYHCDGHGEWLIEKRVAKGKFCKLGRVDDSIARLEAAELLLWLHGGDPNKANLPEPWKKL